MKKFIRMSESQKVEFIITHLERNFKNIKAVVLADEKKYNIPGVPESHYFIFGFKLTNLSGWQSATYDAIDSSISYSFHHFKIEAPEETSAIEEILEKSAAKATEIGSSTGSLESLVLSVIEDEDYIQTGENDAKMIARNIRKYHTSPTDEQIRAEVFNFYNS